MGELDPEVLEFFIEEAEEAFLCLEGLLIKGEKDDWANAELSEVKRILHNLKGTSYSLELKEFGDCVHAMEEILEEDESDSKSISTVFLAFVPRLRSFLVKGAKDCCDIYNFTPELIEKYKAFKQGNAGSEINNNDEGKLTFNNLASPGNQKSLDEDIDVTQSKNESLDDVEQSSLTAAPNVSDFLKCKVKKVDDLINLFSEQVTLQSSLSYLKKNFKDNENKICSTISQLEKVTFDLQKAVFALRMIDLNRVFSVLQRTIRDTARVLNLDVEVTIEGAENELDKSIVDCLIDPLNHLVKNCIDHGLANVKDDRPLHVSVRAFQRSGYFNLEIKDNGMGMSKEVILNKAIDNGIAKEGVKYTENEIFSFIFKNGFSTKESTSEISGRGVGMNVVSEVIKSFKGTIEVDSIPGEGSTFVIKIPLSLAMFNGLVFDVNGKDYVVANSDIREIIDLKKVSGLNINENDRMVKIRDEVIPIVDAHKIFGGDTAPEGVLLVVALEDQRFAIKVDRVSNQQRVVSRELGQDLSDLNSVSGATILSDGTLAPIVNITRFLELAKVA